MNDYLITTFPMKPLSKMKVGSLTAPLYVNFLGKKLNCKKVLSLNILNSFKNTDYSKEYVNLLSDINIKFDDIFVDKEHLNELFEQIKKIDEMGLLVEKEEKIISCDCEKIDMPYSCINSFQNGLLKKDGDTYICQECNSICKTHKEKRLFLNIDSKYIKQIKCIPNIYDGNLSELNSDFNNAHFLISKSRETGIKYKNYNIDIDFVWNLYLSLFKESNIIVVTSNRHLMKVFITNYLANIFQKNIIYILHPYIEKKESIVWDDELFKYDYYYQHLYLIYSCRWNSRSCFYDKGMFNYLSKLRHSGREQLYNYLLNYEQNDNIYKYLCKFISSEINYQNNIKCMNNRSLLIADYDNTLHIYYDSLVEQGYIFKFNHQYYSDISINRRINKFRIKNILCINTGRNYSSFKKVCDYKYDYLICNNGSEIYDKYDNLLCLHHIDDDDRNTIYKYDYLNSIVKYYYPFNHEEKNNLTAVSITNSNEKEFNNIINYFKSNLKNTNVYYKFPKIRLVNGLTNKLVASDELIGIVGIDKSNIYAIGDDDNDAEMLKKFKSGTFNWATKKVKDNNIKVFDSTIEFMNIIEGNKYEE